MTPDEELMKLLRAFPSSEIQNKLMGVTDRELAMSMMYVSEGDCKFLLAFLSAKKIERVSEELRFQKGVRITYKQYLQAVNNVLIRLKSGEVKDGTKSYLRPTRTSKHKRY